MSNSFTPTAANIISSLGVKGATVSENLPGFVPVLDESGKINAKFIPDDAAKLSVTPISDVAFVDPYTSEEDAEKRNGSITAPFSSVHEAAARFTPNVMATAASRIAFFMFPGNYTDTEIDFPSGAGFSPSNVFFIGVGECVFTSTAISITGISQLSEASVFFQNIVSNGRVSVGGVPEVTCLGKTRISNLMFRDGSAHVLLSSESRVSSTNSEHVSFLSEADCIGNNSGVYGSTVRNALDRLGDRRIRLARITQGSHGLDVESSFLDVSAESSGGFDVYDLSERDRIFAGVVNSILADGNFTKVTAGNVTATEVVAGNVRAGDLKIGSLTMGGYRLEIDNYGYLVVSDGSGPSPVPPESVVLLRDLETGATYTLTVSGGRLYIQGFVESASDSDSYGSAPMDELVVQDPDTGSEYMLYVENGRLMIRTAASSSS